MKPSLMFSIFGWLFISKETNFILFEPLRGKSDICIIFSNVYLVVYEF